MVAMNSKENVGMIVPHQSIYMVRVMYIVQMLALNVTVPAIQVIEDANS